jgi:Sap-like sulfolipid-1-addressing protein
MAAPMAHIVLLALAAAVFPTLIACVAIIISRPEPRRLLLAFYTGGVLVSVGAGIVVLNAFKRGHSVVGNSSSNPNPGTSIVTGLLALALGWLMVSDRGRALLSRWRRRHPRRHERKRKDGPSWAERHLDQANVAVAFAIGAAINLPGPFYILALGEIAAGDYSRGAAFGLILLFNAIMFVLIEVPLVGYLVRPERTAEQVAELAVWLNHNGLRVMGALVALVGGSLVLQGIAAAT